MILFFFFNDTATTEIYTLSLHDALPIYGTLVATPEPPSDDLVPSLLAASDVLGTGWFGAVAAEAGPGKTVAVDRKSTRLNSSHANISYAVFCLKKKINNLTLQGLSLITQ